MIDASQTGSMQLLIKPMQNNVFIKEKGQFIKSASETKTSFIEPVLHGIENPEFNAYFTAHGIISKYPCGRDRRGVCVSRS